MPVAAFAPLAQAGVNTLFNLFRIGHADDNVDAEEDRWLREFAIPVAASAVGNGGPPFNWVETDRFIQAIDASRSPLSSKDAAQLINQGDQIEEQLCANFAQQGFGCGGKAGYAGGAGRDIPRTWAILRAKLTEIRDKAALTGLPLSGGRTGGLSLLVPGGAGGTEGVVTAGILAPKNLAIFAVIAVALLAFGIRGRRQGE